MRVLSKQPVSVKGVSIGGAAPLICLPIVAKTKADLLAQADEIKAFSPDLLEWRVDGYDNLEDVGGVTEALTQLRSRIDPVPLIFTCRIDQEGGMQPLSRELRLSVIQKSLATGCIDIVDIELCNDPRFISTVIEAAKAASAKVILSFHDFQKTPAAEAILERLKRAQELGADIAKAAVMPQSHEDVLTLLQVTLTARTKILNIPMITMSMGQEGVVTRLAGGVYGSDVTFAIGKNASAPGQIPIADLRSAMSVLY